VDSKRHRTHRLTTIVAALALLAGAGAVRVVESQAAGKTAGNPAGWTVADPPSGPHALGPNLTMTKEGLILSWLEPIPQGGKQVTEGKRAHALRVSRLRDGRWSAPVTIHSSSDFFANWADFPAVAQAPDGSLTAHWLAKTGTDTYAYGIFLARSTDGGATWQPAGLLHADRLPVEHGFVSWISDRDGLRAFWLDGRETAKGGATMLRTGLAGKTGTEKVLDPSVCDCCQTDAAMTTDGPVVVFRDRMDKEMRDISLVRRTAGGWSQPTLVHKDDWQIPGCPVNGPAVAASGKRVAVAWFTAAEKTGQQVKVAFSEDGGQRFGPPVVVDGAQPLGRVDLQLDASSGSAIVTWMATGEKGSAVRVRRVGPKGAAGPPVTLAATSAARSAGFPRTAVSGDRLWLTWVEDLPQGPSRVRVGSLPLRSVR
jgi:hypothetical protein